MADKEHSSVHAREIRGVSETNRGEMRVAENGFVSRNSTVFFGASSSVNRAIRDY